VYFSTVGRNSAGDPKLAGARGLTDHPSTHHCPTNISTTTSYIVYILFWFMTVTERSGLGRKRGARAGLILFILHALPESRLGLSGTGEIRE
jgi:hypothetical protein